MFHKILTIITLAIAAFSVTGIVSCSSVEHGVGKALGQAGSVIRSTPEEKVWATTDDDTTEE